MVNASIFVDRAAELESPQKHPWQDGALCTQMDPDQFFPTPGGITKSTLDACTPCLVKFKCLKYALSMENPKVEGDNPERWGIYGGLTPNERKAFVKLRVDAPRMTFEQAYDAIISSRKPRGNQKF